ncbi:MAG: exo-alpha-sialidase [Nitrososphaerota archaeon]|nr:exo-alpha-sialidase [Nitrososphaerota archaeon]
MKLLSACFVLFFSFALLSGCNKDNNPISPSGPAWTQGQGIQAYGISGFGAIGQNLVAGSSCAPCSQAYVFLSADNGLTWNLQGSFHVNNHVPNTRLYIYPQEAFIAHGGELYLGIQSTGNGSIYESADNGMTWTEKDTSFTNAANCFAIINNTIFVGTLHGVFRSTDGGTSWKPTGTVAMSEPVANLAVIGSVLFAGTNGVGIYRSTDLGESWAKVNPTSSDFRGLATIGNILFAAAFGDSTTGGVFVSTDLGESWKQSDAGLSDKGVDALCASATELFAGTSRSVFASTDQGVTWKDISVGVGLPTVGTLSVSGLYLFVGTSSGVWRYSLSGLTGYAGNRIDKPGYELTKFLNPFNQSISHFIDYKAASFK